MLTYKEISREEARALFDSGARVQWAYESGTASNFTDINKGNAKIRFDIVGDGSADHFRVEVG